MKKGRSYHIGLDGKKTRRTHQCLECNKQYTEAALRKLKRLGECSCGGAVERKNYGYHGRD